MSQVSRKGPLLIFAAVAGGLLYATYGGRQQPRPLARGSGAPGISEALESAAGTGGTRARGLDEPVGPPGSDIKDAHIGTSSTDAPSKRSAGKEERGP
ncbi:uncharacterized protein CTHT_0020410 [Thermochaetoides thermophila DSM 1495]|uniref:Uncharacterized protein n=1 Tax=Chaetomium thermophilum (strain DSM 1495 / CBS 144.50 / IMI 039719) TaxID=759272 RepID=G0S3B4_CHATD|nr:hypothetical protein CTHT_0020410 [Thermochaetoides thermophila DSM 1495]EGS22497.1 hypothetical protein CTHT_0020410 [Thermochaetoides thermophila DSM 1495]